MNRLSSEKSAYLKHAASQKIDWYPWGEEAFARAQKEDKPVFLSSGAIWCHWCHVMAKECFADDEIVNLLNEGFIPIKIDRDERPDIDRRYQQAVSAMGSGGGWPLSVFLTPDRKPFFGGTYFPPEDRYGRPGFKKVLKEVLNFYRSKKDAIAEYTERLIDYVKPDPLAHSEIDRTHLEAAVADILAEYDAQNGGFGTSPKFPMPGAVAFLISRYYFTGIESVGSLVHKTLTAMATGGMYDQLQGGFHRYSTDEAWLIPHFEKMADDNAWLLKNYIDAYGVFGDTRFKDIAEGIINFLKDVLSDPQGGFYASQDADVTPDDEGGYFTWTEADFRNTLNEEEYRILARHFLNDRASMHHDESKKVLFIAEEAENIARELGMDISTLEEIINNGKEKLLSARSKREEPFIDRAFYTSLNGMLISSCLLAYRTLRDTWTKDFALKSLETIMKKNCIQGRLFHSEGIRAVLDDYVFLVEAFIAAYEVTGNVSYLNRADELMERCIDSLWDKEEGGFFDSEDVTLGIRLKGVEDIPHPSSNGLAIILLLKLYDMTGKDAYITYAETALRAFASKANAMGIHSGYYYAALDAYFNMLKLAVETTDPLLRETALFHFSPHTSIVYGEDKGCVTPCIRGVCLESIKDPEKLRDFLEKRT